VTAAAILHDVWLPNSGEPLWDFPLFFRYANTGLDVQESEMITDISLTLQ